MLKGLKQAFNGLNNLTKGRNLLSPGRGKRFLSAATALY
jgi:hypothetical protein